MFGAKPIPNSLQGVPRQTTNHPHAPPYSLQQNPPNPVTHPHPAVKILQHQKRVEKTQQKQAERLRQGQQPPRTVGFYAGRGGYVLTDFPWEIIQQIGQDLSRSLYMLGGGGDSFLVVKSTTLVFLKHHKITQKHPKYLKMIQNTYKWPKGSDYW